MTQNQFDLSEFVEAIRAGGDIDVLRRGAQMLYQALIEAEASEAIGAEPHERSATRTTRRNGHRSRTLSTKAGDVDLKIPKLRRGSFFPSVLERRRRVDQALYAVVMEAYVHGVSTRKVDDLVAALGVEAGLSKSEVSRICAEMDADLEAFRTRPLTTPFPYLFLDATYVKARVGGRVVSRAVVVATGVATSGDREILGLSLGDSEDEAFWSDFLRSLRGRGLAGVQLVVSDHHAGLKAAIAKVLLGASWQRCRVHFMRNVLSRVSRAQGPMVAAAIRTIFAQPDGPHVRGQLREVAKTLKRQLPEVTAMLLDAEADLTAFADFPVAHWTKVWSTNPLERVNAEIKRRTRVVGIFPNDAAALRLITAVVIEQHDEWQVAERRYLSEESMALLHALDTVTTPELSPA